MEPSRPVVETRVAVAQLLLLGLRQALETVVALASGTHAILTSAVEDAKDGEEERNHLAAEVDRVPVQVLGCVGGDVCPSAKRQSNACARYHARKSSRCNDAADGSQTDDVGSGNSTHTGTGRI